VDRTTGKRKEVKLKRKWRKRENPKYKALQNQKYATLFQQQQYLNNGTRQNVFINVYKIIFTNN